MIKKERASETKINVDRKDEGYIYIMRNPTQAEGIFKIGLTTRTVEIRAKELSKTSNSDRFYLFHKYWVIDCKKIEKLIHKELHEFRVDPKREFFKIDPEYACRVIEKIIKAFDECNI